MFGIPPTGPFPVGTNELFLDFRYNINTTQLEDLMARTTEDGKLTVAIHNDFLVDRLEDSLNGLDKDAPAFCENVVGGANPQNLSPEQIDQCEDFAASYFRFSEEDTHVTSNQYVFPTFILGEDDQDFGVVDANHIRGLWEQFRFPEGYAPRSVRHQNAFSMECYLGERERFQTINEWTIKRRLMLNNMEKAGVSKASRDMILAETFLETNSAVVQELKDCPNRARLCPPLAGTEREASCISCDAFPIAGVSTPSNCPCDSFRAGEAPQGRCPDSEVEVAKPWYAEA